MGAPRGLHSQGRNRGGQMASNDYRPLLRSNLSEGREPPQDGNLSDPLEDGRELAHPSELALISKSMSLTERVPPEWAVLLLGCALGLATGASVVLFNLAVINRASFGISHVAEWRFIPHLPCIETITPQVVMQL